VLEFRETDVFTAQITRLLSDQEYAELQGTLVVRPDVGDLIEDTGRSSQSALGSAGPRQGQTRWNSSDLLLASERIAYLHVVRVFER